MAPAGRIGTAALLRLRLRTPLWLMHLEDVVSLSGCKVKVAAEEILPPTPRRANTRQCSVQHKGVICLLGLATCSLGLRLSRWHALILWPVRKAALLSSAGSKPRLLLPLLSVWCSGLFTDPLERVRVEHSLSCVSVLCLPLLRKHYRFQFILTKPGPVTPGRAYGYFQVYVGYISQRP